MDLFEIAEACLKLGIPMAVLSSLIFSWLHSQGKLDIRLGRKAISAELKQMKKTQKDERVAARKDKSDKRAFLNFLQLKDSNQDATEDNADLFYRRWMWFGGGFYGLAALWTFAIVEVLDVLNFISNFPGISTLIEKGIVTLLIELIVNQITNIVSAFIWFTYWTESSVVTWVVVAYLGYLLGIELAKRRIRE